MLKTTRAVALWLYLLSPENRINPINAWEEGVKEGGVKSPAVEWAMNQAKILEEMILQRQQWK